MPKKLKLEDIQKELREGFKNIHSEMAAIRRELRDDLRHVRKDILAIHSDLIQHDERADKMLESIREAEILKKSRTV
ncbi:hypothetical protein A2Z53_00820 [Candidatus Giovannonibacteria bacterium RIFCSPHIGHO2_02_42_15]|uniref:Uncharacterized protein n=2 Tax=Candidatus Giovannoniibacteriota TaxID=1752738 RepID=A0A1F5VLP1_9BACT|nr:MAG: hypothetical protein UV11_C0020G0013 [Candidatus Giovannonibacteria bacterium GW2011_GWF2_42_19]OGF64325.1 MAG: hypothetical protein A2Z53_00820 [Candidatus Giovannonibacteria bacterium RIFCSPHIGHO2_02_42_15]